MMVLGYHRNCLTHFQRAPISARPASSAAAIRR